MEPTTTATEQSPVTELPPLNLLEFVTYPSGAAPTANRDIQATVRAHVARRQHRQSSRRHGDPFRNSNVANWTGSGSSTVTASSPSSSSDSIAQNLPTSAQSGGNKTRDKRELRAKRAASKSSLSKSEHRSSGSSTDTSRSQSVSPLYPFRGSTQEDPFWTFPVDYSPLFPPIIAHYIQNLAQPVAELDGPAHTGLLRTHWFPMAMMSPATMYSLLLMAASHYSGVTGAVPSEDGKRNMVIHAQVIHVLKARALDEIDRCLRSDKLQVAVGDATIGAVAKVAAFEAVFGDEHAYRQHMAGLMKMLQVRRSIGSSLGPVDEFLKKLVGWIDVNAAYLTGAPFRRLLDLNVPDDILEPNP